MGQWPKEAVCHPGKMRYELASSVLNWVADRFFFPQPPTVVDVMAGIGTTVAAARDRGWKARGKEINPLWVQNTRPDLKPFIQAGDSILDWGMPAEIYMSSPEFPNTHPQGDGKMQAHFKQKKATYAGNEMSEWGSAWHRGRGPWTNELESVLRPQLHVAGGPGLVIIHIKDYVREGKIIDVGTWVEDCFVSLGITLLGDLIVPITYKTHFTGPKQYPRRKIVAVEDGEILGVKVRREIFEGCVELEDGMEVLAVHDRFRKLGEPQTKEGHCTKCPKLTGPTVDCERLIVGQIRP